MTIVDEELDVEVARDVRQEVAGVVGDAAAYRRKGADERQPSLRPGHASWLRRATSTCAAPPRTSGASSRCSTIAKSCRAASQRRRATSRASLRPSKTATPPGRSERHAAAISRGQAARGCRSANPVHTSAPREPSGTLSRWERNETSCAPLPRARHAATSAALASTPTPCPRRGKMRAKRPYTLGDARGESNGHLGDPPLLVARGRQQPAGVGRRRGERAAHLLPGFERLETQVEPAEEEVVALGDRLRTLGHLAQQPVA